MATYQMKFLNSLDSDKSRKILDAVIHRIEVNPSVFHGFIEAIAGPSTDDVVKKLHNSYERHKTATSRVEQLQLSPPPHQQPPPEAPTSFSFPHLDTSSLDEDDRIELEDRLIRDTRKMIISFTAFTLIIQESFENQRIPLERIKDSVLSLDAFNDGIGVKVPDPQDKQEIKNAKNLPEVFMTLRDYISFFNYEIVQYLIELLGSPDDQTQLREYCSALDQFCQRNVFEVPAEAFSSKSRIKTAKVFVLKCTERVATLECVKRLTRRIAEALGLQKAALQLHSVKQGCLELHFLITVAVAKRIYPVSPTVEAALSAIGVLTCESTDEVDTFLREQDLSKLKLEERSKDTSATTVTQIKDTKEKISDTLTIADLGNPLQSTGDTTTLSAPPTKKAKLWFPPSNPSGSTNEVEKLLQEHKRKPEEMSKDTSRTTFPQMEDTSIFKNMSDRLTIADPLQAINPTDVKTEDALLKTHWDPMDARTRKSKETQPAKKVRTDKATKTESKDTQLAKKGPPPRELSPLTLKWRRGKDMPFKMGTSVQSVVIGDTAYVSGSGADNDHDTCIVMKLEQDQWTKLPEYTAMHFAMTSLANRLVLVGGHDVRSYERTNQLAVFESVEWTYPYPPMNIARDSSTAVSFNDHIIVAGGWDDKGRTFSVEVLDVASRRWYIAQSLPNPRSVLKSTLIGNILYLMGGYDTGKPTKAVHHVDLNKLIAKAFSNLDTPTLWQTIQNTPLVFPALSVSGGHY
ncbi:uncharacterized protein LOC135336847 [Halichondria panicea]|uniref:uncharacterized protein LOC135336847 n=1 Tax=Halichondria panicea TaxID=6063 RepID=UPI00312B983C